MFFCQPRACKGTNECVCICVFTELSKWSEAILAQWQLHIVPKRSYVSEMMWLTSTSCAWRSHQLSWCWEGRRSTSARLCRCFHVPGGRSEGGPNCRWQDGQHPGGHVGRTLPPETYAVGFFQELMRACSYGSGAGENYFLYSYSFGAGCN